MNPITFNDKFAVAIGTYPAGKLSQQFKGWQSAPLFDYETNWDKELTLLQEPTSLADIEDLQWPFAMLRLAMVERDVPDKEGVAGTFTKDYTSHFLAGKRNDGTMDLLIWWRETKPANKAVMLHVFTYHDQRGHHTGASLYVPRHGGWELNYRVPEGVIATMCGSAIASFASFLIDCTQPTNHVVAVRPTRGNHSVHWQLARVRHTLITHGHPANSKAVAERQCVPVDAAAELKRMSGNRRGHWRTYRHERYTYARNSRRWVKQTWCGPKEWMDAGGKQIYKILEPVAAREEVLA